MIRDWMRMLLAVLLGNVVYFSAEPFLSAQVRHSLYQFDAGLILDFAICFGIYLLLKTGQTRK
jgi:hypothetical protein